jgi:hypothetical protein
MNKYLLTSLAALIFSSLGFSQQAKIIYERTVKLQISFAMNSNGGGDVNAEAIQNMMPKTMTNKFELQFANLQSIWKEIEEPNNEPENMNFGGPGGGMVTMRMGGSDELSFCELNNARKVDLKELGTKKVVVEDSIRPLKWKLSEETKTILGKVCRKATTEKISTRMMMTMNNGKMERQETSDTNLIVAWFTLELPVPAGPAEFQAQLPGLILEMDINKGKTIYKALEISDKVELALIKEPKASKKMSAKDFESERQKMMDEMMKNNGGVRAGTVIRIGN